MAVHGSDIVVGGSFSHIGGESRKYVARINATTGALRGSTKPKRYCLRAPGISIECHNRRQFLNCHRIAQKVPRQDQPQYKRFRFLEPEWGQRR